jgi:glutamine amidotransferase
VLGACSDVLKVRRQDGEAIGWGVGFYQFGECLMRRRPLDERPEIDSARFAENLRTDILIGHVRRPTVGNLRTENTHPFRFRQWLFAQTGTIGGTDDVRDQLLELQAAFLRPNVRGDTDSELFFYLVLAELYAAGQLDERFLPAEAVQAAIRNALLSVDKLCQDRGLPVLSGDSLLTDGEQLIAVHRSGGMLYRLLDSREALEHLLTPESSNPGATRNMDQASCCVIVSDVGDRYAAAVEAGWRPVPTNSFAAIGRTGAPQVIALDG